MTPHGFLLKGVWMGVMHGGDTFLTHYTVSIRVHVVEIQTQTVALG